MKVSLLFWAAALVLLLWIVGNLFTGPLQEYFIFRNSPLPDDYRIAFNHPHEEVFIQRPGGQIHGIYLTPESPKGAVLYFHGNRGNVERWIEVADDFLGRGYAVFIPDYRGYGKSRGERSEAIFFSDALACREWLGSRWEASQIVVYGRSIGSAAACGVAAREPGRLLFLETPFYSMKDLFYTYYPFFPGLFRFQFTLDNGMNLDKTECPVIIVAGSADRTVPLRSTERLRRHLKPGDRMEVIDGGEHNDLASFPRYTRLLDEALR